MTTSANALVGGVYAVPVTSRDAHMAWWKVPMWRCIVSAAVIGAAFSMRRRLCRRARALAAYEARDLLTVRS
jgi:hypothetical protein